ncbi:unnamed protein product [Anisakis simplex]|uniref:Integron gene cassette protein n=1 Tax=Anisakis simplex TaxID=6269 RepID=A0A0M3JQW6_ANISI|nr:unnamed protein product [Anisakis simplex]
MKEGIHDKWFDVETSSVKGEEVSSIAAVIPAPLKCYLQSVASSGDPEWGFNIAYASADALSKIKPKDSEIFALPSTFYRDIEENLKRKLSDEITSTPGEIKCIRCWLADRKDSLDAI